MFKVNNRNTTTRCEICSKLTIKTSERHHHFSVLPLSSLKEYTALTRQVKIVWLLQKNDSR